MAINFRYKTVRRPDGTEVKTPSIPIRLNGTEKFDTIGLIDSGADVSAIPQAVAEILGLEMHKEKAFAYGIGGKVESTETRVSITVEKGHEHYTFEIPVKIILGKYDFPILLGRAGFFDKFLITFNQTKEKVKLKKATDNY